MVKAPPVSMGPPPSLATSAEKAQKGASGSRPQLPPAPTRPPPVPPNVTMTAGVGSEVAEELEIEKKNAAESDASHASAGHTAVAPLAGGSRITACPITDEAARPCHYCRQSRRECKRGVRVAPELDAGRIRWFLVVDQISARYTNG